MGGLRPIRFRTAATIFPLSGVTPSNGGSRPEPDVHIRFDERPDRTKAANQPY
jgi:hypothetical protein